MVDLSMTKDSKNFVDRVGKTRLESLIGEKVELTDGEKELMKKNDWSIQDMIVIKALKKSLLPSQEARGPDKNFPTQYNPY